MKNLPQRALNSAVECHPHTVEVIGSNPIAPTIFFPPCARCRPENLTHNWRWSFSHAMAISLTDMLYVARVSSPAPCL
jgi:hypothetical protein